jgi:hypothetical protein
VQLPFNFYKIDYKDSLLKIISGKKALFISPSFSFMLQLGSNWSFSSSIGYNQTFGDILSITPGYILKNYRRFSNNNTLLAKQGFLNLIASITYRNPLKILFLNTWIVYSRNKSNLLYRQLFNGNLETISGFPQNNFRNNTSIYGRFSKYVIDLKTTVGCNYNYNFGDQQLLQQGQLVVFNNRNYSIGITVSAKLSRKINTEYSGNYAKYSSGRRGEAMQNGVNSFFQNLSLNYSPANKFLFRIITEHYYLRDGFSQTSNYYFADAILSYKPTKSKIDYELGIKNIFNTNTYITSTFFNTTATISEYKLRPRQLLFRMIFSF